MQISDLNPGSEVLFTNEKDSTASMLVETWNTNGEVTVIWRDNNGAPHRETYNIGKLKLKPAPNAGYAAASGGGSRNN